MPTALSDSETEEIRQLARTYQYDRYISALLMPKQHRDALIVLAAFAGELQRLPFIVTEPMMAAIRLQWWRDELTAFAAPKAGAHRSGHFLCDALAAIANQYALPYGLLQGMIDAAETELDATPLAETDETRQVLIKFEGAHFELSGRVLGANEPSRTLWTEAAIAYGATRLAGEHGWRKANGAQTYVCRVAAKPPADGPAPDISGLDHLAGMARAALSTMRERYSQLDRSLQGTLLPLATVQPSLHVTESVARRGEATAAPLSQFARARAVLWAHWRHRI